MNGHEAATDPMEDDSFRMLRMHREERQNIEAWVLGALDTEMLQQRERIKQKTF